jgi:hypothetical protein
MTIHPDGLNGGCIARSERISITHLIFSLFYDSNFSFTLTNMTTKTTNSGAAGNGGRKPCPGGVPKVTY